MTVALIWLVFFGLIQLIGWLFYWQAEQPMFPIGHHHAKPTLTMDDRPDR